MKVDVVQRLRSRSEYRKMYGSRLCGSVRQERLRGGVQREIGLRKLCKMCIFAFVFAKRCGERRLAFGD